MAEDKAAKCKILVVDDIPDFRNTLSGLLTDEGYVVYSAAHEEGTWDILDMQEPFDFALIDVRLHGGGEGDGSGWNLAMAIQRRYPKVHIIMLTQHEIKTEQVLRMFEFLNLSRFDFIVKTPDVGKKVLETIAKVRKRSERTKIVEANKKHGEPPHTEIRRNPMDWNWNAIVSLAVFAVSPYAVTFATSAASAAGKKLVEAAPKSMKGIWQWIRETVSRSDDESAKHALERFEEDPESNK